MTDWNPANTPNFTREEMACRCGCGRSDMNGEFMEKLQTIRRAFNKPMAITSGYRCPVYNAQISATGLTGPHTTGKAADIAVYGADYVSLLRYALMDGFTGIGSKQHGPHSTRFLHLDILTPEEGPRPTGWTYK